MHDWAVHLALPVCRAILRRKERLARKVHYYIFPPNNTSSPRHKEYRDMSSSYSVHPGTSVRPSAFTGLYGGGDLGGDGWVSISFGVNDILTIHNQTADSLDYLAQRINEAAQDMRELLVQIEARKASAEQTDQTDVASGRV